MYSHVTFKPSGASIFNLKWNKKMKPSNFKVGPWDSVFQQSEYETIAFNIIVILERSGDEWENLTWEQYKEERLKDGNFSEGEKSYFDKVMPYCLSWEKAITFSPAWAKVPSSLTEKTSSV